MSVVWVLLVAATGASPADSSQTTAAVSQSASAAPAVSAESPARSAKELRQAVVESLRRANSAKAADRGAAIQSLVDLFHELGRDRQLSTTERQRLGAEVRSRLARFATQFRHEMTRNAQWSSSESASGAAGGGGNGDLACLATKTFSCSGISGSQMLDSLSTADATTFCGCLAAYTGGYGSPLACTCPDGSPGAVAAPLSLLSPPRRERAEGCGDKTRLTGRPANFSSFYS